MGYKIKVISDGINHRVVNAETGEEIPGIVHCRIILEPGEPARADLEFLSTDVEIVAAVDSVKVNDRK